MHQLETSQSRAAESNDSGKDSGVFGLSHKSLNLKASWPCASLSGARPKQGSLSSGSRKADTDLNTFPERMQGKFTAIKDSLSKIVLPADLRLNDSRSGITRQDQGHRDTIVKCAHYAKTLLKLVGTVTRRRSLKMI